MEFKTYEDIEAPLDTVFSMVADFEALERSALRRGIGVRRMDRLSAPGPGMIWSAAFEFRGKKRTATIEMTDYEPPEMMAFQGESGGLDVAVTVELVALSRRRTRLSMQIVPHPRTLSARLLVQSLKLARGNLAKRFRVRIADYAKDLEDRARRTA